MEDVEILSSPELADSRDLESGTRRNRLIRFTAGGSRQIERQNRQKNQYKNRIRRLGGAQLAQYSGIDLDSWQRRRKYSQWRYHQIQRAQELDEVEIKDCWSFTSREIKSRGEIRAKERGTQHSC